MLPIISRIAHMSTAEEMARIILEQSRIWRDADYIDSDQYRKQVRENAEHIISSTWVTAHPPLPGGRIKWRADGLGWHFLNPTQL